MGPRIRRPWPPLQLLRPLLLVLLWTGAAHGLKVSTRVEGTDQLAAVVMNPTGLAAGALVTWSYAFAAGAGNDTVVDLAMPALPPVMVLVDNDQIGAFYRRTAQNEGSYYEGACLAPAALRVQLEPPRSPLDLSGLQQPQQQQGAFRVPYTGQFSLLLLQCAPGFAGTLDVTVDATTLNPDVQGRLVHHLGLESLLLPRVFGALLAVSLALLLVWLVDLAWLTRPHVSTLHVALALGLGVKAVELAMLAGYFAELDRVGEASVALLISSDLVQKLSMLTQLLILLLLAIGWKTNREQLTSRETRMVMTAFAVYLLVCAGQSICNAGSSAGGLFGRESRLCQAYNLGEYVLQSLILLAIIVSINFNITASRAVLNAFQWSSHVPLQYKSLQAFGTFRLAFLVYLLLPTLLLVARVMLVAWPYAWVDPLLRHALYLTLYVALALAFAPHDKELYRRPFALEPWRAGRGDPAEAGAGAGTIANVNANAGGALPAAAAVTG